MPDTYTVTTAMIRYQIRGNPRSFEMREEGKNPFKHTQRTLKIWVNAESGNRIIDSPNAPDYSGGEFFMGSMERKGGALVAPGLALHVATKMRDEASIAKESRKAREAHTGASGSNQAPKVTPPKWDNGKGDGKDGKKGGRRGRGNQQQQGPGAPAPN